MVMKEELYGLIHGCEAQSMFKITVGLLRRSEMLSVKAFGLFRPKKEKVKMDKKKKKKQKRRRKAFLFEFIFLYIKSNREHT